MSLLQVTMGELLREKAHKMPQKEAFVFPERGLRGSYKDLDEWTDQVAKGLMALGIGKGDHFAVWSDNKPEWLASQFASGKMGGVLVTVNTSYKAKELEYLLKQSDSETLIMAESYKGTSYVDILREICPELDHSEKGNLHSEKLPALRNVIVLGDQEYPGCYTWKDLTAKGEEVKDEELREREATLSYKDVINMQYTSGTTGFPKGVMLSHYNIVNNANQVADCMNMTDEDRLCIPVPFFHCFGCVMGTTATVAKGATMVVIEQFEPKLVLQAVKDEACTALHGVPTMFIAELNHPEFENLKPDTLRTGIMAGSTCPMEVMKSVINEMGVEEITIAYGQTESSPVITQTRPDDPIDLRVKSVGRAHPNVEVKVVEPATGEEAERGMPGELCTRGYLVMEGYYKDEESTETAIDPDGWLHTGDIAEMDENGYVEITGRMKDMIIRGGENIYPREIEEFLYQHPDVLDVQVVGIPDATYGEEIMAWIIPKEDSEVSEKDIRAFFEGEISKHKIPAYIYFTDEYPMTASGKIQKFKLREAAVDMIGR
ncbi:AMP-binding protein [Salimicrobium jeotgali]|uniref:AMP-binding domain protein n=1 Tax=Salimicrobium jeotgali TaxID=1230341 RepID=K2H3Z4_9BACI|nr:AMP-binding protein [Salimicrobium jeotgali]AKG04854.1 AMP-binding protein [Salimicrobium jeotgali]EKE30600.1 AMP-binding domain protein [Salimicrobium jeotgali]MBM7696834.1 fatty-acyl-CoA synthase [Salimicrobium jeotgali]